MIIGVYLKHTDQWQVQLLCNSLNKYAEENKKNIIINKYIINKKIYKKIYKLDLVIFFGIGSYEGSFVQKYRNINVINIDSSSYLRFGNFCCLNGFRPPKGKYLGFIDNNNIDYKKKMILNKNLGKNSLLNEEFAKCWYNTNIDNKINQLELSNDKQSSDKIILVCLDHFDKKICAWKSSEKLSLDNIINIIIKKLNEINKNTDKAIYIRFHPSTKKNFKYKIFKKLKKVKNIYLSKLEYLSDELKRTYFGIIFNSPSVCLEFVKYNINFNCIENNIGYPISINISDMNTKTISLEKKQEFYNRALNSIWHRFEYYEFVEYLFTVIFPIIFKDKEY